MAITRFKHLVATALLTTLAGVSNATIIQIEISIGQIIEVNLFDENTPATVANFLSYVDDNSYDNTLVHRSIGNFITQGGGYYLDARVDEDEEFTISSVTRKASVINEPIYSNVRGTIAMAKLSSNPNSATSEWFINLADNSCNLDKQNSGFTVFGQITQNSLAALDAIAALPTYDASSIDGALTNTPLDNYAGTLTRENFVFIEAMTVTDPNANSANDLTPAPNIFLADSNNSNCETKDSGGSGAPSGGFLVLMLSLLALGRRTK